MIIIERLHRSSQVVLERWSRCFELSSAPAMPVYFVKPCTKFTFRGFSEEMPPSRRGRSRGPLLSILVHFFEHGRWGSPVQRGVEGQSLTAEDQALHSPAGWAILRQLREDSQRRRCELMLTARGVIVSFA